jgi:16S rRNA (adenine1518-N6/adenine1519-N6)-dimethyltransferase
MTSPKQSVSFLRRKFDAVGFHPSAKRGQNFLIDLNLLDLLVRAADLQPNDVVLEIGTGTGSLTTRLACQAAAVVTVEVDPQLAQLAREQFDSQARIVLLQQDVLLHKNRLHPSVLNAVHAELARVPTANFKLVANLPFAVATPVISMLGCELPPSSMTVTIQKELADRIVATPCTKDYGSFSVWVQCQCWAMLVRELAPTVFWPRPQVASAIIQLILDPGRRAAVEDLAWFQQFIRTVFLHRRKRLRGALLAGFKSLQKPAVTALLDQLGLPPEVRAEELDVGQLQSLASAIALALAASREPA